MIRVPFHRRSRRLSPRRFAASMTATVAAAAVLAGAYSLPARAVLADPAHVYNPHLRPVSRIADTRMPVDLPGTPAGRAEFPLYLSLDWNQPQPQVTRAVIVIHGKLRNAYTYFRSAEKAREAARESGANVDGTLLIAPQFLATLDFGMRDEPADLLRWDQNGWMAGDNAVAPAPLSSYAVLDAIVERLADRTRFPNLRHVVFAGHSGGGQVVQRYAVAARESGLLAKENIDVRYVISSPSSYAYFDAERPDADGKPAPFGNAAACPAFNDWKYGMEKRPAYLSERTAAQLEATYATRRVYYLVGGDDNDPQQKALDQSCSAEAQGPQRVARAEGYFRYLQMRHPQGLNQSFHVVPGVGHDGARMLGSVCALAAIYDTPGCKP
ncbi:MULTISPECIES: alpha/beta hydrolase [Burkholderiaceae]|uniref:alpha/beta hydrolase n=1 Tax=Burkholderiaceae TaxID=119060 RepID=UPI001F036B8B|nr:MULTISPECIES: alpha/beta hydrolase [Burkholderiaceae]